MLGLTQVLDGVAIQDFFFSLIWIIKSAGTLKY